MDQVTLQNVANDLVQEALASCCDECGVLVAAVGSWGERERRRIRLANGTTFEIAHDEREAPYDVARDDLLVSLSDEVGLAVFAWAQPFHDSHVVGIGIDLAQTRDFAGERGERFNPLLFSPHEQAYVQQHYENRTEMGFAYAFSAKEAAFKSLAAPLRTWYATHDEELLFEIRNFELADATHERGTLRDASAQSAMDAMDIRCIELHHREAGDVVLTLALAWREKRE